MSTRPESDDTPLGPGVLMAERPRLISLAYRFLGSLTEAEDVVQETYARWYAMSPERREAVAAPGGWLTTVASRICLDLLGSARVRRESYVGEWLPEPVPDRMEWLIGRSSGTDDPADRVTLDESVSMAFLVVLESLTPAERVAFVLHDVFHYTFVEVAEIVGRTPAACRQLASSARRRMRAQRPAEPDTARRADVVSDFRQAWESQDIKALIGLLDPDVTAVTDGGGVPGASLRPVLGGEQVALNLVDLAGRVAGLTFLERTVNGRPGLVVQREGTTLIVLSFDVVDGRIQHIWAVRNPDKLRPWTAG